VHAAIDALSVARSFGFELASWRPADAGQGRTALAEGRDGRGVVIKWFPLDGERLARSVRLADVLHRRGYPCPATIAHGPVGDGAYACILERLPGEPRAGGLGPSLLGQLLAAVELQAGATDDDAAGQLGGAHWSYLHAVVFDDEEGWWRAARARGREAADLCGQLADWVRAVPRPGPARDIVHLDLNFTNILIAAGRLTGIIDLDHLGAGGDRSVDLATLLFEYILLEHRTGHSPAPDAVRVLHRAILAISGESGWRAAVTFRSVADLGWTDMQGRHLPLAPTVAAIRAAMQLA
jgi:aminoglycoside phosphotransferase (APT) family kinase protein